MQRRLAERPGSEAVRKGGCKPMIPQRNFVVQSGFPVSRRGLRLCTTFTSLGVHVWLPRFPKGIKTLNEPGMAHVLGVWLPRFPKGIKTVFPELLATLHGSGFPVSRRGLRLFSDTIKPVFILSGFPVSRRGLRPPEYPSNTPSLSGFPVSRRGLRHFTLPGGSNLPSGFPVSRRGLRLFKVMSTIVMLRLASPFPEGD